MASPTPASPSRRRWADWLGWLALVVASCWPLWAALHNLDYRNDDSYITLTYVKSLVAGHGWRYNGGPVALGTTAPLFALTVAALATLLPTLEIAHVAVGWSALCWLAAGWLLAWRGPDFGLSRRAGQLAGVILLLQSDYWVASLGMEATMLIAALLGACWLAARGHALGAGLVGALLGLVRPEGWAMLPVMALWLLRPGAPDRRRSVLRLAGGAGIILLGWLAYAIPTFGSPLANSARAKLAQGQGWGGALFIQRLAREWLPVQAAHFGPSAALSLLWPLAALGLVALVRPRARPLLMLAGWALAFLIGYSLLRAPGYWWYMISLLALLHLLVAVGLACLVGARQRWGRAVGAAALLIYLACLGQRLLHANAVPTHDSRAEGYQAVAAWLNANSAPTQRVAYVEIGYLGYYAHNPIVDLLGLVDPALRDNATHLDIAANVALSQPDFLLYHAPMNWLLGPVVEAPDFAAHYRPVAEFPHVNDAPLILYERR